MLAWSGPLLSWAELSEPPRAVESGMIRRGPDSPGNFGAPSPEPVTTAAPPRRKCARRGLDPIPRQTGRMKPCKTPLTRRTVQCHAPWPASSRTRARAAGEAGARPPGVWDVWIARLAGQGSRLDRRERRRGAEPFRRLPRSRPRAPGGDCPRDARRPAQAGVRLPRPLGRIRLPDAHALGSIGPARPGRGQRSRGRVQDLPERSDLRELVMPGTASRVAGRRPPSRRACRARLPSVRAVRPHHRTGVMDCHVCAGATCDGVPDRGQP